MRVSGTRKDGVPLTRGVSLRNEDKSYMDNLVNHYRPFAGSSDHYFKWIDGKFEIHSFQYLCDYHIDIIIILLLCQRQEIEDLFTRMSYQYLQ